MTTLTFDELVLLIHQNHSPSIQQPTHTLINRPTAKPKKRIGLLPIDERVYEWLDKPIDDLFDNHLEP